MIEGSITLNLNAFYSGTTNTRIVAYPSGDGYVYRRVPTEDQPTDWTVTQSKTLVGIPIGATVKKATLSCELEQYFQNSKTEIERLVNSGFFDYQPELLIDEDAQKSGMLGTALLGQLTIAKTYTPGEMTAIPFGTSHGSCEVDVTDAIGSAREVDLTFHGLIQPYTKFDTEWPEYYYYYRLRINRPKLTLVYEMEDPSPDMGVPDDEVGYYTDSVVVFPFNAEKLEGNGNAVLMPTACDVTVSTGGYSISVTHPIDPQGKWTFIQPRCIIGCPVPEQDTDGIAPRYEPGESPKHLYYIDPAKVDSGFVTGDPILEYHYKYRTDSLGKIKAYIDESNPTQSRVHKVGDTVVGDINAINESGWQTNERYRHIYMTNGVSGSEIIKDSWLTYIGDSTATYIQVLPGVGAKKIRWQLFRIQNVEIDWNGKKVSAVGYHISYDLKNIAMSDCNITAQAPPQAIRAMIGSMTESWVGRITTDINLGSVTIDYTGENAMKCMIDPDNGIASLIGAKVVRDNMDILILNNSKPRDSGLFLSEGKNLTSLKWTRETSTLITRVVPVGRTRQGKPLFLPEIWVDSELVTTYGVVTEILAVSEADRGKVQSDEEVYQIMRNAAKKRFDIDKADQLEHNIKVSFVFLGDSAQYAEYKNLHQVGLYDIVHVSAPSIGLTRADLQVVEIRFDALKRRITGMELSNLIAVHTHSISGFDIKNSAIGFEKLSPDAISKIRSAITSE